MEMETAELQQRITRNDIRIVVTDSGMGGLSVAADLYERLKEFRFYNHAELIYFNAQPHLDSGYNMMEDESQKIRVFHNALTAMQQTLQPDVILIACNTLSVLYDKTAFSRKTNIPVLGIVETGVELIHNKWKQNPEALIALFATETTVEQGLHKAMLIEKGIPAGQIVLQACPDLAGAIERGPESATTTTMIQKYVGELARQLPEGPAPLLVSYNCTHYGYADKVFRQAFRERNIRTEAFLNPNPHMADVLLPAERRNRFAQSEVSIRVVSQPEIIPQKLQSIHHLIQMQSPDTANALKEHTFVPDFFEWSFK
jgi:glutamate racemase